MEQRRVQNPTRRALFFGGLMALIVFGGAVAYLLDTRPRSYRAEGGDAWLFARYQSAPGQHDALTAWLRARVARFDAEGFWGAEVLEDGPHLALLTRWRSPADAARFQSQKLPGLAPDPSLLAAPPVLELWSVSARR